jgi:hypothetical protein
MHLQLEHFSIVAVLLGFEKFPWTTGDEGRASRSSDGSATKPAEQGEKKNHRRVHSLGSYLPSFFMKRTASIPSNLDKAVSI